MADEASTRFPFISLDKALARAQSIFNGDRSGKPMSIMTAFELWGYSPKSSGGFQTVGALKGYGLLEHEGANADRKVRISPAARRYFLDERDDVRQSMLVDFALSPTLFRALWTTDKWAEGIPADPVARSHLKVERGLNDQSARSVLAILKENVQFAGLKAGPVREEPLESEVVTEPSVKPDAESQRGNVVETVDYQPVSASAPIRHFAGGPSQPEVRIAGDRVMIVADVDLRGLRRLKKQLAMFEQMLEMADDDEEAGSERAFTSTQPS